LSPEYEQQEVGPFLNCPELPEKKAPLYQGRNLSFLCLLVHCFSVNSVFSCMREFGIYYDQTVNLVLFPLLEYMRKLLPSDYFSFSDIQQLYILVELSQDIKGKWTLKNSFPLPHC